MAGGVALAAGVGVGEGVAVSGGVGEASAEGVGVIVGSVGRRQDTITIVMTTKIIVSFFVMLS